MIITLSSTLGFWVQPLIIQINEALILKTKSLDIWIFDTVLFLPKTRFLLIKQLKFNHEQLNTGPVRDTDSNSTVAQWRLICISCCKWLCRRDNHLTSFWCSPLSPRNLVSLYIHSLSVNNSRTSKPSCNAFLYIFQC